MNSLQQIGGMAPLPEAQKTATGKQDKGFAETLKDFAAEVNDNLQNADGQMKEFAVGKRSDLHEVVIATEKADLSFKLLLQVRNKILDAYQQIMRMQV